MFEFEFEFEVEVEWTVLVENQAVALTMMVRLLAGRRSGTHVNEFPLMPIGIGETVLIHEAVILRLRVKRAAGSDGFANEMVHLSAAVAA